MQLRRLYRSCRGFTLIEIMLVIVLLGFIATMVQLSFSPERPEDRLQHVSAQFSGIFSLAADYAMLNNVELGLLVTDNEYKILGYDGTGWSEIPDQDIFQAVTLPDGIAMTLQLDDLPIDEAQLFDASTLVNEDDDISSDSEKKEKLLPQVYILSGGDITPFSLSFHFDGSNFDLPAVAFKVTGLYSTPLALEGPVPYE